MQSRRRRLDRGGIGLGSRDGARLPARSDDEALSADKLRRFRMRLEPSFRTGGHEAERRGSGLPNPMKQTQASASGAVRGCVRTRC